MSSNKGTVGLALCGFGRAGQIHFGGICRNPRCELKYVVDLAENESVKETVQRKLDEYLVKGVQLVGTGKFDDVQENICLEMSCLEDTCVGVLSINAVYSHAPGCGSSKRFCGSGLVLQDPEVDAVVVTTPTDNHESYVRKALQAGKAVFCEKPVAAEKKRIRECYELADQVKRPLFCAFNRRFDPGMSRLRDQVREGKVGQVYQVKTTSRDSPLPGIEYLKISNGIFHDCAVHDLDMVCWVLGEQPVGVFAQGSAFSREIGAIGDVDTVAIVLKFPSGVLASIDLSRHSQYGYDQRLEFLMAQNCDGLTETCEVTLYAMVKPDRYHFTDHVLGSKGMIQVKNVPEDSVAAFTQDGKASSLFLHSFPQRYREAYELELNHFVSVVLDPSVPLNVTKEEVLLSSEIADACERSLKEGKMITL